MFHDLNLETQQIVSVYNDNEEEEDRLRMSGHNFNIQSNEKSKK